MVVTYVIAQPCIDVADRACVDECPVDCIYEGRRALGINADECIDCGACEPVCPVEAIYYEDDVPAVWAPFTTDNVEFFTQALPGRTEALGSPGGRSEVGRPRHGHPAGGGLAKRRLVSPRSPRVARDHPEVVCAVHLGLLRGSLTRLDTCAAPRLVPFVEPEPCWY
jgi:NAD-dependent dihydropyrimidine dehydrogenase PreA subunit